MTESNSAVPITLIDGRAANTQDIVFDEASYRFTISPSNEDLTDLIYQRDKAAYWDGFDKSKDNERMYVEHYMRTHGGQAPPATGSTSTWVNFYNQITTDPFKAPLESLDNAAAKIFKSNTVKVVAVIAGVALALYAANTLLKLKAL